MGTSIYDFRTEGGAPNLQAHSVDFEGKEGGWGEK